MRQLTVFASEFYGIYIDSLQCRMNCVPKLHSKIRCLVTGKHFPMLNILY